MLTKILFYFNKLYVTKHKGPFTLAIYAAISRRVNYWRFKLTRNRQ